MFNISLTDANINSKAQFGVFQDVVTPPSPYVCPKSAKLFSRFFYVTKGETVFNKGTKLEVIGKKGDIIYLPNDIAYVSEWDTRETGGYISLHFLLEEFYMTLPDKLCVAITDKDGSYLKMFENALATFNSGAPGYKLDLLAQLYRIMHRMYSDTNYRSIKSGYRNIYKGILYLENNNIDEITVEQLANMCNMSECNFRRYFKKYTDMSPITYRNFLRIKKARDLLQTGEYNVTEAAAAVNIPDNCYFHKLFRQFFNCTPKKFIP
ncbi:MAG: helix-turn-helix transcriptional regulator [Clostridia bacterium]|nr:helix-turn-helix transcriptional regulator [Clostridia bacterium]